MKSLYFSALVLPDELCRQVQVFKQEFADRFGTKHGLQTIPHITLLPPFHADETGLEPVMQKLASISSTLIPFEVELAGFGHFGNDVLYIGVTGSPELDALKNAMAGLEKMPGQPFRPHVTLAHRDVKPWMLREAWPGYKDRVFKATYKATSISLLKLEDGRWVISLEFPFGKISP